jgi:D-alanyl-D-alanine carboxypeptidase (penicillin-binding protein 5/6)
MADTLARWAFGSTDKFLAFANSYAGELGMKHTAVTDPSGLDASTVSTPGDLIMLGEAALASPVVAAIVREPNATIPVQGEIKNYNALLGLRGIVGIKTGNNDANPGCFLLAAERTVGGQQLTILAVLMEAPNLDDALYQTLPLLFSVEQSFTPLTIAASGQKLATYHLPWDGPVDVGTAKDVTYVAWKDSTTRATLKLDTLGGATASSTNVGKLRITNSRVKQITDVPLWLDRSAPTPSIVWRLMHPI